jgi:aminoglycoside 6'-N-acetyltransferase
MSNELNLQFSPLRLDDLDAMYHWFQTPHIKEWYAKNLNFSKEDIFKKYSPRIQNQEIPSYLIVIDNHKIGFIQYYNLKYSFPEGIENHAHRIFEKTTPANIAGIDLFIGESKYLAKGIGSLIIKQFINEIIPCEYKLIVVDPNIENKRAIQCYLKSGFSLFSVEHSKQYNETIQLMTFHRK